MKKSVLYILGALIGVINGIFGAGGGMLAVPVLKKAGLSQNAAHENAVALILPTAAVSTVVYYLSGNINFSAALPFVPSGLIGALVGTLIIKKISPSLLRVVFSLFMIWAGIRMLFK